MQKLSLLRIFGVFVIVLCPGALTVSAQSPEQVYANGKSAFERNDYLVAVKSLYAYQQMAAGGIPDLLNNQIDQAIRYCDDQILLAIRTKEELDTHGQITEVIVEASGKADGAPVKKTEPFHPPAGTHMQKPGLPSQVPNVNAKPGAGSPPVPMNKMAAIAGNDSAGGDPRIQKDLLDQRRQYARLKSEFEKQVQVNSLLRKRYTELQGKYRELKAQSDSLR